ncbi:MAG: GH3 auxin-responsive promoter family protein [Candidatus Omnitrophica bacterium]|nr:GH3 auxin-responsive promoter family protein [Candidatus Omnitrophota bacterium]
MKIVRSNEQTEFGRKYNFKSIRSVADFQKNIPIQDYKDVRPFVEKILTGEQGILTDEKVILLEPTSGSTGAIKYIPYTQALKKEFQKGIEAWLFDVYIHNPWLLFGKSFWSITPREKAEHIAQLKVGFEQDIQYLGSTAQYVAKHIMVSVPDGLTTEEYLEQAYLMLKSEPSLSLISIWSPTFLDCLFRNLDCLPQQQWSKVRFVSAWGDASSRQYEFIIKKYFPRAKFQRKGLLSTECMISFPLERIQNKSVLSYQSHFFEFLDKEGNIHLAHQLQKGGTYTVIVTTSGGLYRYNTHDDVQVNGFYHGLPVLEFIGRSNNTGDFFGEKLSESFVSMSCQQIFEQERIAPVFFVVIFDKTHYVLLMEADSIDHVSLADKLNLILEKNYHYKNCIRLGQLKPLTCQPVTGGIQQYTEFYLRKGLKLGDIKIKALDTQFNMEGLYGQNRI